MDQYRLKEDRGYNKLAKPKGYYKSKFFFQDFATITKGLL